MTGRVDRDPVALKERALDRLSRATARRYGHGAYPPDARYMDRASRVAAGRGATDFEMYLTVVPAANGRTIRQPLLPFPPDSTNNS